MTVRRPSRHSNRTRRQALSASCSSESWRCARAWAVRMDAISAAANRKETASMIVTATRPPVATMMPPMAGPISRARWLFMPVQRVGGDEVVVGVLEQVREQCALGRGEQQVQAARHEEDDVRDPDAQRVDRQQRQQHGRQDQVDDHHQALAVPSVHEDTRHRAEQDRRDQEGEHHGPGGKGRAGAPIDLERQADDQDPVARHRDQPAEPQLGEVGLAEDSQHRARLSWLGRWPTYRRVSVPVPSTPSATSIRSSTCAVLRRSPSTGRRISTSA